MDRVRRIAQFWNWLPAFRAVGETQHLPTAAAQLGVSAPALSRTVKQLEQNLDLALFHRQNQGLELNEAGQDLLRYVRNAMRLIDDGLLAAADSTFRGPVRVAATYSAQISHILPSLSLLYERHPHILPEITTLSDQSAGYEALKNGDLDVAFVEDADGDESLLFERVDDIPYGIYAAPEHPLAIAPPDDLDMAGCAEHRWVAPCAEVTADGWPAHIPRNIRLRVASLGVAIHACETLGLLMHMPDSVGAQHAGRLRRVLGSDASHCLFVARRSKLSDAPDRISVTIDAVRALVEGSAA